ncbi:MAG: RHS repeat-associated core domain-containing protein [Acidobacteriota bacterium]|nr:MAG: RHS repeat-associated core domain-containing protein [Acidobacteriota bacterium]
MTGHKQTTDGQEYATGYVYNLSGALVEQTYPSGRVVKNVLDANGDLSMVQSKKGASAGYWNYAQNFTYNAAGAVTSMQLGNGKWESTQFNSRLQPTQIALGATPNATNLLKLDYSYGATANNGNVLSQTITVPTVGVNTGFTAVQSYQYDSLNRLQDATENVTPHGGSQTQSWRQAFTFDRYGNRNFDEANTTTLPKECNGNTEVCEAIRPIVNPSANTANNRLNGYTFDAAGNITVDAENRTFIYDAENKQTEVRDSQNTVIGQYRYDGDGKRVKKIVPATGEVTVFVYDASGKSIAEYSTVIESVETAKVAYLTADHLGSPRINTDRDGNVTSRRDFHPFGEQIYTSQRTTGLGYDSDSVRKQFTGYELDTETDLDFAQARYFSHNHGRFMSSDDFTNDTRTSNPQSWNLYVYVRNNPLNFTDPTGMYVWGESLGGSQTDEELNRTRDGRGIVERRNQIINTLTTLQALTAETARARGLTDAQFADIQRAVSSYGAVNVNNGVTVEFGNIPGNAVAQVSAGRDARGNVRFFNEVTNAEGAITGVQANVVVTFESISADNIVHEGSHIADRQALATEFFREAYTNGNADYDAATSVLNLTQYETENRAYTTESNYVRYRQGETDIWGPGWSNDRRQTAIDNKIRDGYRDSQNRRVTPQNQGDRIFRWQRRQ